MDKYTAAWHNSGISRVSMLDKFYNHLHHWVDTNGPRTLIALAILIVGFMVIALLKRWLVKIFNKTSVDSTLRTFLARLVAIGLQVLLVLMAIQAAGVQLTLFATIIGAFSVAAGLALSGTLQNFTSGILILLLKPYKIGDNIVTQGQEGVVCEIQLFYTVMKTFDNRAVIIPNSKLSNDIIINNSRESNRRVDVEVKIASYAPDIKTVRDAAQAAIRSVDGVLSEPAPTVSVSGLDADGWRIMVRAWVQTDPLAYEKIKFAIQENLMDRLKTGQVKLPGM